MKRINIGCGRSPTSGWTNFDNSPSLWLAKHPVLARIAALCGFLNQYNRDFISFAKSADIGYADASKRIPEPNSSVDVLYSSHMLEHLDRFDRDRFLKEAFRVLKPGGILRLAVPNIRYLIDNYLADQDADNFIATARMTRDKPRKLVSKIRYVVVGDRNHQWMYDGASLCKLLASVGFSDPQVMPSGETRIPDPGNLNLSERAPLSVFVEAIKPH